VQAVVVEAELAEGDELGGVVGGGGVAAAAGLGDEVGEVGHDLGAARVVDAVAVEDRLGWVRAAGGGVLGLLFSLALALALVVVFVVGRAEDGAAAGVDTCGCKDGAGEFLGEFECVP
jgi:hypothetical protein